MSTKLFNRQEVWNTAAIWVVVVVALFAWTNTLVAEEIPFEADWAGSGHADANSEAFIHWDGDSPPVVPTRCAKCHSTPGYLDFLGEDGTAAGVVDNNSVIGTVITCEACHNDATITMSSVTFPSGMEITGLGSEARCMQCHQGRESGASVDEAIADANVAGDDDPNASLGFKNVHYLVAGAVQLGGEVLGGYQYDGKTYDIGFAHVEGIDTCNSCHDPHNLQVKVSLCTTCHIGVATAADLLDIRFAGSQSDYDGDGNLGEGIHDEIVGLQEILYAAIQTYANTTGTGIVYDSHSYPYFFIDTNGNGQVDPGENSYGNKYNPWTPRLLKAAYNYQFSLKDPGGFAHNGKYIIQLLYDSIEDLDAALVANLHREDPGHFAGSNEAFRHWDEDGEVSGSCSKCHSAAGLPTLLKDGVTFSQPISNGLDCATCHDSLTEFTRHEAGPVEFPSGVELDMGDTGDPNSNLCINCHQGRESTVSVNGAIAGLGIDTVSSSLGFKNVHYLPAGATLFGANAKGAYEYMGKVYNGRLQHEEGYDTCIDCHDSHNGHVDIQTCQLCHSGIQEPQDIRIYIWDYDGDGDNSEGIAAEIETLHEALYPAMQTYASTIIGTGIIYDSHSYPYFFKDTNGNGQIDPGENSYGNKYNTFTPRLLRAAYNYQYVAKEPGGFAHNGNYVIQVLYDSLESLGANMTGMVRPGPQNTSQSCGDATHPYPPGDFNQDCTVDFHDFAIFCASWLDDNNP
ncbi:MAG: hypothetical protein ACYS1A_01315 [Planctomycetota bacterium]|jgi:hypothetical protein